MATKKNTTSTEAEIMQLLTENSDKLKILLSASKDDKPLKYKFKGKKSTKTVFMSIKLQYLINEYCIENDIKIGDVVEAATVEYLTRHGWDDKISDILEKTGNTGETGTA
ncbi:MAG: hypothetical protein J1G06_02865 [Oscillospiraceae bacterium]|nr:hypothetical protein [Oscillospiraceae bacterium]